MTIREGGCLCGGLRYRISADPTDIGYCHCRMCQRSSGAPAMVWATMPASAFAWTQGRPGSYRSSERAGRLFCPECGSPLVFKSLDDPDQLDIAVASLDDPAAMAPMNHIWVASRLPWFETTDSLPRHQEARSGP